MQNPSKYLGNELKYIEQVLNSENWTATGGSWNKSLEGQFANKFGANYGIAMNSGTSTIHACLEAGGVTAGDEVISPAMAVIMDTNATLLANAIPVYADIDPETFVIDPKDIERKITKKTKAIIVVTMYGLPVDYDPILKLAKEHNLVVVEDNAQCYLSEYKGRVTGTIGDMASYSFENTKHISCGEGGIVITNNEKYAEMVRKIGGHGYKNLRAEEGRVKLNKDEFQYPGYKRHDVVGWNYRLSEFGAAIALAQLERLDDLLDLRIKSANTFLDVMEGCKYLVPQKVPEDCTHSYYTLAVKYEGEKEIGVSWVDFYKEYVAQGGDGYYGANAISYSEPVMVNREYEKRCPSVYEGVNYEMGLCPIAEDVQSKLMLFKTNYRDIKLAELKAEALSKTIRKFNLMSQEILLL